jgi:hypothetical protein
MTTSPILAIAALQTLNARLLQERDRLAQENEDLRARLAAHDDRSHAGRGAPAVHVAPPTGGSSSPLDPSGGLRIGDVWPDLVAIARESAGNASAPSLGSIASGQRRAVGFANADGYLDAVRRGVSVETHAEFVRVLRQRFHVPETTIDALPGPVETVDLPAGTGVVHTSPGTPLFDRPPAERQFLIGQAARSTATQARRPSPGAASPARRILAGGVPVRRSHPAPVTRDPAATSAPRSPASTSSARASGRPPDPTPTPSTDGLTAASTPRPEDDTAARFALLELD